MTEANIVDIYCGYFCGILCFPVSLAFYGMVQLHRYVYCKNYKNNDNTNTDLLLPMIPMIVGFSIGMYSSIIIKKIVLFTIYIPLVLFFNFYK